jgi:hypothetical protein
MSKKIEVVLTCPLGAECEKVVDGKIHRCQWYINVKGKDPQSEKIIDQWGCAMGWLPVLILENAQINRGQTQAIESFRNEMVKGQNVFNLLTANMKKRLKE